MQILKNAWFERFAKKEKISEDMLKAVIENAQKGLIDADLGNGVIKQRISRPNQGKSGGYRSIILYLQGDKAVFVYGYAKSQKNNIRSNEKQAFKDMANYVFALSKAQIKALVDNKQFFEVNNDD